MENEKQKTPKVSLKKKHLVKIGNSFGIIVSKTYIKDGALDEAKPYNVQFFEEEEALGLSRNLVTLPVVAF